jgi:hypothetical protein
MTKTVQFTATLALARRSSSCSLADSAARCLTNLQLLQKEFPARGSIALDHKYEVRRACAISSRPLHFFEEPRADLLEGFLGSHIVLSDDEQNAIKELKRVIEHQRFQLTIVTSAPKRSFQKSPTNLDLGSGRFQIAVARASNDSAGLSVNDRECAFRRDRTVEKFLKYFALVTVVFRMLFPDQRIARGEEKRLEIVRLQRAKFDQISRERRLEIKFHGDADSGPSQLAFCETSQLRVCLLKHLSVCVLAEHHVYDHRSIRLGKFLNYSRPVISAPK